MIIKGLGLRFHQICICNNISKYVGAVGVLDFVFFCRQLQHDLLNSFSNQRIIMRFPTLAWFHHFNSHYIFTGELE